jgi:hypothetical protein
MFSNLGPYDRESVWQRRDANVLQMVARFLQLFTGNTKGAPELANFYARNVTPHFNPGNCFYLTAL